MVNLLDIYARASRRLPLTPAERAFLKTADTLLLSALAGAAVAIVQAAMSGQQPLTFAGLAQIGSYAAATALLAGASKLFRAQGDALSQGVAQALDQAERRIPSPMPPPQQSSGARGYRGPVSGPVSGRLAAMTGAGSFPPMMPGSPQRRADLLRQAGATLASDSQPSGPVTRPVTAVSPAQAAATQPMQTQTPAAAPSAAPVPSQAHTSSPVASEATSDGPPTLQMAAVRAGASTAAAPTAATNVPANQWLTS